MKTRSSKPLVSIYIVNYNYGRFLTKAIDSVLNQTYSNLEIIIIDDGSSDNSYQILETFSALDNLKILKQDNQGLISTIRNAVNICTGEYIMRLDADDWLSQHAVSVMVEAIELKEKTALVYPDYYLVDETENIIGARIRHQSSEKLLNDNPPHGACSLIRKSLIQKVGGTVTISIVKMV